MENRLRALRRERGLMQRELADRIGLSPATVSRLERSAGVTRVGTLQRLCAALGGAEGIFCP